MARVAVSKTVGWGVAERRAQAPTKGRMRPEVDSESPGSEAEGGKGEAEDRVPPEGREQKI
ncbi:hypothetical protein ES707_10168 [subsurface metagenome]